jgi:hypothetical protein
VPRKSPALACGAATLPARRWKLCLIIKELAPPTAHPRRPATPKPPQFRLKVRLTALSHRTAALKAPTFLVFHRTAALKAPTFLVFHRTAALKAPTFLVFHRTAALKAPTF